MAGPEAIPIRITESHSQGVVTIPALVSQRGSNRSFTFASRGACTSIERSHSGKGEGGEAG